MSDSDLTEAVRGLTGDAAVEELYRRHRGAVFAYALACCRDPHTAEDLTSEAFTRTIQTVRSGGGPESAWRPYLLTVIRRTAADWAKTARRTELSPDFELWVAELSGAGSAESGEERMLRREDRSLVLRAFRSLPERWQTVLWHMVIEEEPAAEVGRLLGVGASGVASLAARAREGLREAYLNAHVDGTSGAESCRHYSALLGAAVRRSGRRTSKDLDSHLDSCQRCRRALMELTDLNERLRGALSAELLLWGSSAYLAARTAEAAAGGTSAVGTAGILPPDGGGGAGLLAGGKAAPLGVGAGVAAVGLAVIGVTLLPNSTDEEWRSAPPVVRRDSQPPPAVTVAATSSPSPSPSKSESKSPSKAASKPPKPSKSASPSPSGLGDRKVMWSSRFISESNGYCVGTNGSDVVQNPCDGSDDQTWELIPDERENNSFGWLRNADTGKCIDYEGPEERDESGAAYIFVHQRPCRPDGERQHFRLREGPDGTEYIFASTGQRSMVLGMHRGGKGGKIDAARYNQRMAITVNIEDQDSLRYRLDYR